MATGSKKQVTGWVGWVFFASLMLMVEGGFQVIDGLVALFRKQFFVTSAQTVVVFNLNAWGWINLIMGIVTVCAGYALMRGALWARIIAVLLASLSLIANIAFLPAYPVWSIIMGIIDVVVIYAVALHGEELAE